MEVLVGGRSASEMPGLDIAEMRSWHHFLEAAVRMSAILNRGLLEVHQLTLNDVRLLDMLSKSATGSARMGDLAEQLMSLPSRVTRQIRRLEADGLVRREASPEDRRGVLATITEEGRATVEQAMTTYGQIVKAQFLSQLTRPQVAALGENCRRINHGLKVSASPRRLGRV
ncbi:MAG: MarR family transcriptional regulator [Mycobacterium sp.]